MKKITNSLKKLVKHIFEICRVKNYPNITASSRISDSARILNPNNIIMEEHTNIDDDAVIMNTRAKFIMKRKSGAAFGLTVVCGGHMSLVGRYFKDITDLDKDRLDTSHEFDKDIIVEEDVWIGSRVTLLKGSHLGRGCVVGSNSCVRNSIPPYATVIGNPAKIVGFKYTPEEIIQHEKDLYPEEERLPLDLLEKNYNKYFISRIKEIKEYTRLSL